MNNEVVETLKKQYMDSSTEELIAIRQKKGGADGKIPEEGLEAIRQILIERENDEILSSASITGMIRDAANMNPLSKWSYGTARDIARVISFAGWLFVGLCAVAAVITVINGPGAIAMLFIPIIIGAIGGFLMVAAGQVLRATVDNADNTGQILALIKTWALEKNTSINKTEI